MKPVRIVSIALLLGAAAGCAPREEAAPTYAAPTYAPTVSSRLPAERSYLDPGPAVSRGGPGYLQNDVSSAPRQTDFFGNDLLRRGP